MISLCGGVLVCSGVGCVSDDGAIKVEQITPGPLETTGDHCPLATMGMATGEWRVRHHTREICTQIRLVVANREYFDGKIMSPPLRRGTGPGQQNVKICNQSVRSKIICLTY